MIRLRLDDAMPLMRLARPAYSPDGRILLGSGAELSATYLSRLRGLDIRYLWIRDDRLLDVDISTPVPSRIRHRVVERYDSVCSALSRDSAALKGVQAGGLFDTLVADTKETRREPFPAPEEGPHESALTGHSIRVCLLTLAVGILLPYSEEQLRNLALGSLLHDIGHVRRTDVDRADFWDLDRTNWEHAHLGFESVVSARHLSATVSIVCQQHHERLDGSGHPRGIPGRTIHAYARLTAIADEYDTLVSGPAGLMPHEARQRLREQAGTRLDANLVKLFLTRIAPYPPGTPLRLGSSDQAVVIGISTDDLERPCVRVLPREGDPTDVDLASRPDLAITAVGWSGAVVDQRVAR